jgi:hypothetical protein
LSAERLKYAKADAIVLHPGPLNRGIEITPEVADSAQSCILEQVTNGIAVRMALLFLLMTRGEESIGAPSTETAQAPRNRRATDAKPETRPDANEVKDPTHAAR